MSILTIRGTWTSNTCSRLRGTWSTWWPRLAAPLRMLHLGAGGLTLARYAAATRPGSRQLAVESDAEVARLVRQRLPVGRAQPGTGRIGVRLGDARAVLERLPAGSFDVVVADVFAGDRTPAHLTSVEFTRAAARALAATGVYAVNVGDGPPLAHARGRVAAVRAVFPHVCVMAEPAVLRGRRFGNLVVVGSGRELPLAALTRRLAADPFPARLMAGAELDGFTAGCRADRRRMRRALPAHAAGSFCITTARQHVLHDDPLAAIDKLTGRIQVPIGSPVLAARDGRRGRR